MSAEIYELERRTTKLETDVEYLKQGHEETRQTLRELTSAINDMSAQSHKDRGETNRLLIRLSFQMGLILIAILLFFVSYLVWPEAGSAIIAKLIGGILSP